MSKIKTVASVRPLPYRYDITRVSKGGDATTTSCVSLDKDEQRLTLQDPLGKKAYSFQFDRVCDSAQHSELFGHVVPLLEGAVDGINSSVFAYGAGGTGKTRLMLGYDLWNLAQRKGKSGSGSPGKQLAPPQPSSDEMAIMMSKSFDTDAGIILRSMKWLLEKKESLKDAFVCEIKIVVSYFEIYADEMRDLLKAREKVSGLYMHSTVPKSMHTPKDSAPDVRNLPDGSTSLSGLIEVEIASLEDVMHILWAGAKLRNTVTADVGDYGAQSNTMFSVNLRSEFFDSSIVRTGKIMFVDLAGVERASVYGSSVSPHGPNHGPNPTRHGNKGLTVLGKVLNALQESNSLEKRVRKEKESSAGNEDAPMPPTPESSPSKSASASHLSRRIVPYRESKLTRVLTDCLGMKANSLFFCTLSSAASYFSESLRTCKFSEDARRVKVEPSRSTTTATSGTLQEGRLVSEVASTALLNENKRLKSLSRFLFNALSSSGDDTSGTSTLSADIEMMLSADAAGAEEGGNEKALKTLHTSLFTAKNEKAVIEEEVSVLRLELEREREEKREICRLVYSADVPQLHEVLDLEVNSDDDEETIARKEKQYYHTYGRHRDHHISRRGSSLTGSGTKTASPVTTHEETKGADYCSATSSSSSSSSSLSPPPPLPPTKDEISSLTVTKPALPKDKKVNFAMQSALLEIERQTLARQKVLLMDWKKAEDLRWSFVTHSINDHAQAVKSAQEEAAALGVSSGDDITAERRTSMEARFEGLKERTKMMELTLQVQEQSMQSLKTALMKSSSKGHHRASLLSAGAGV